MILASWLVVATGRKSRFFGSASELHFERGLHRGAAHPCHLQLRGKTEILSSDGLERFERLERLDLLLLGLPSLCLNLAIQLARERKVEESACRNVAFVYAIEQRCHDPFLQLVAENSFWCQCRLD